MANSRVSHFSIYVIFYKCYNIINAECNMSRFKVILKDVSLVNKDAIQKLGAKGIVEIDNQLKIIFGKDAHQLKKYIDDII